MPVRWYYQNHAGVVGPVSVAELKYLIDAGTIGVSTLVREGADGPWLAVEMIEGLLTALGEGVSADESAPEITEWHLNLKGQDKQGPVPWSVLKAMVAEETLQPDDVVWKPGMAMWVPASQVAGLMTALDDTAVQKPGLLDKLLLRSRPRALWAGVAAIVLLGLIVGAAGWRWSESRDHMDRTLAGAPDRTNKDGRQKGSLNAVEQILDDARTALRAEQIERATRLLDQYLASPGAEQVEAAKLLLREIKRALSGAEAARIAENLRDHELIGYLQHGVDALVGAIETPELRPLYEQTLLRAFRQENNRRQMIPRGAVAQNQNPVDAGPSAIEQEPERGGATAKPRGPVEQRPKLSVLGPAEPAGKGAGGNPDPKSDDIRLPRQPGPSPGDLDCVLARPGEFVGNTLVLNGLFKIGTKITEVKGPDGQVLGSSLPVARGDDSLVCSVDGKVAQHDTFLLLDDGLAAFLDRVFDKLRLRPAIKPSYKCLLTVTARRLLVNGSHTPVVVISSLEVLGGCNYVAVARHQYDQAFRTLKVAFKQANVDFGDGNLWVERLGGEEKFVQPIRRKFREMQRRAITDHGRAMVDAVLQRELVKVVNTASAINQIVAMEGLRRLRVWP